MRTYDELKQQALANPAAREEYERLNREEFAILDAMLIARSETGLSCTQVAAQPE